ncbi:MAG TPA: PPOX class F420-dependent oxidoreductase [Actinocrinis sp.]|nr:PPOX class F420-dependent oxidoreductase [Actinocrinis sp.]
MNTTELGYAKYISLTTYRKTGEAVPTTVWTVPIDDKIYVSTGSQTGKVKRLRNNTEVAVALCDMIGKNVGPAHKATARLVPVSEHPEIRDLMLHKYGFQQRVAEVLDKVRNRSKKPVGDRVLIELTVED